MKWWTMKCEPIVPQNSTFQNWSMCMYVMRLYALQWAGSILMHLMTILKHLIKPFMTILKHLTNSS